MSENKREGSGVGDEEGGAGWEDARKWRKTIYLGRWWEKTDRGRGSCRRIVDDHLDGWGYTSVPVHSFFL